jgi:hypothetical protein
MYPESLGRLCNGCRIGYLRVSSNRSVILVKYAKSRADSTLVIDGEDRVPSLEEFSV